MPFTSPAKPRGSVGHGGSASRHRSCNNGVCTVTQTFEVYYKPPATIQNRFFKFDTIVFAPVKPMKGYGPVIGVLVRIDR